MSAFDSPCWSDIDDVQKASEEMQEYDETHIELDLDRLERLATKATNGPMIINRDDETACGWYFSYQIQLDYCPPGKEGAPVLGCFDDDDVPVEQAKANAEFFVEFRRVAKTLLRMAREHAEMSKTLSELDEAGEKLLAEMRYANDVHNP